MNIDREPDPEKMELFKKTMSNGYLKGMYGFVNGSLVALGTCWGFANIPLFKKQYTSYQTKFNVRRRNIHCLSAVLIGGSLGMYLKTAMYFRDSASMAVATTTRHEDPIVKNYPNGGVVVSGSQSEYRQNMMKNHNQVLSSLDDRFERRQAAILKAKEERKKPTQPGMDKGGRFTY